MNFACGVTTYRAFSTDRFHFLRLTVNSLLAAFPSANVYVLDNDSQDESPTKIRQEFGDKARVRLRFCRHPDDNRSPGRGYNSLIDWVMSEEDGRSDVFVMSDDDMRWHDDAGEQLEAIYGEPVGDDGWDESVVLVCGLLEPDFDWATARSRLEPGGVPVLVRDTVPTSGWTFRMKETKEWPVVHGILPAYRAWRAGALPPLEESIRADVNFCKAMVASKRKLAAADLADHLGVSRSKCGNSPMGDAIPLDRKKWRI